MKKSFNYFSPPPFNRIFSTKANQLKAVFLGNFVLLVYVHVCCLLFAPRGLPDSRLNNSLKKNKKNPPSPLKEN